MKKILIIALLFTLAQLTAQVGINTDIPRGSLEVKGDIVANEYIFPENLDLVQDEIKDLYYLLVQTQDSDKNIKLLDVTDSKSPGIAALVTLKLTGPDGDWIKSFNTKIDASKYALVVMSGYYTDNVGYQNVSALPGIGAFIQDNTWHINADYPSLDRKNENNENAWVISCSIFHKNYVKLFNEQTIDMENSGTKSALKPLL